MLPSRKTCFSVLTGAMVGSLVGLIPIIRDTARPAIVMESLQEGDNIAVRGGSIELAATVRHQKDCRIAVDRWLTRRSADGSTDWWPLEAPHTPPTNLGDGIRYRVHIPLPPDVPPGDYAYRARAVDECTLLPSFLHSPIRDTGDVPIHITTATADAPVPIKAPPGPVVLLPQK